MYSVNANGWAFNTGLQPMTPANKVATTYVAILMDAETGLELSRTSSGFEYRGDVASAYAQYRNVGYGGFRLKFPMKPEWKNKKVFIMIRFAKDVAGHYGLVEDNYLLKNNILKLPSDYIYKVGNKVILQNNATHDINGQPILKHLIGTMGTVSNVTTKASLLNGINYPAYQVTYADGATFMFIEQDLRPTEGYLEFNYAQGSKVSLKTTANYDVVGKVIPKQLINLEGVIVDRGANQSVVDKKPYASYRVNYKDGTSLVFIENDLNVLK